MTTLSLRNVVANDVAQFAEFLSAFKECSQEIQEIVHEMAEIISSEEASDDDKSHAIDVMIEALFPSLAQDFVEHDAGYFRLSPEAIAAKAELDVEEATFAERLKSLMDKQGINQEQLAKMTGVSQPAISNMLSRNCRPQRKTIARFAEAFGVSPEELWP